MSSVILIIAPDSADIFFASFNIFSRGNKGLGVTTVSYTHLDVYKRQKPTIVKVVIKAAIAIR